MGVNIAVYFQVLERDNVIDEGGIYRDKHVRVCIGLEQILHLWVIWVLIFKRRDEHNCVKPIKNWIKSITRSVIV